MRRCKAPTTSGRQCKVELKEEKDKEYCQIHLAKFEREGLSEEEYPAVDEKESKGEEKSKKKEKKESKKEEKSKKKEKKESKKEEKSKEAEIKEDEEDFHFQESELNISLLVAGFLVFFTILFLGLTYLQ